MTLKWKIAVLTIVMAWIVVCLPQNGLAQDAKIAVIDVQTLTLMSDEGKAVSEKLEKRYQEISAEMQKTQKEIEEKETRLRTQDRVMSATAKAQLAKDIEAAKIVFDRRNQDYQKEMNDLQNELISPVAAKAQQELSAYIEEKGFTLVMDLSAEQGNIVWVNPGNEITPDVMKRLNENYKASGGKPRAAPAATPPKPPAPTPPATAPQE
jgi:Skp family chaperone for outer membrane proteins